MTYPSPTPVLDSLTRSKSDDLRKVISERLAEMLAEAAPAFAKPAFVSSDLLADAVMVILDDQLVDTSYCAWCEEAESPVYLEHRGHDDECPFAPR